MDQASEMTVREAAQRLKQGLSYTYHLIWEGRLTAKRRDGRWFIPSSAVDARLTGKAQIETRQGR